MKDSDIIDIAITLVLIVIALYVGNLMIENKNWIGLGLLIIIVGGLFAADFLMAGESSSGSRRSRRFARGRQRKRPLHSRQRSKSYIPPPSAKDPLYPSTGKIKVPSKQAKKLIKKK